MKKTKQLLGGHIAARRKELGLSQEALAGIVGADPITVYRWEKGVTAPRAGDLQNLADALKTTPAALYGGSVTTLTPPIQDMARDVAEFVRDLSKVPSDILEALPNLGPEHWDSIRAIIDPAKFLEVEARKPGKKRLS